MQFYVYMLSTLTFILLISFFLYLFDDKYTNYQSIIQNSLWQRINISIIKYQHLRGRKIITSTGFETIIIELLSYFSIRFSRLSEGNNQSCSLAVIFVVKSLVFHCFSSLFLSFIGEVFRIA